ncbi:MAG: hypothetical protein AB7H48_00380 [Parachlamydiales bacterium]
MEKIVGIKWDEIWPISNILNEVCHGFYVHNFENNIGAKKPIVVDLMDKISEKENEDEIILFLNDIELNLLKKSFEEVLRQIEEWEFQTRIGVTIQEAKDIMKKIL